MKPEPIRITFIDGPTILIEIAGLRILTDPTFDDPRDFSAGPITVHKFNKPPVAADSLLPIHVILVSHDQHFDNLDIAGRAFLPKAGLVLSTVEAAERLGGNTRGLKPWSSVQLPLPDGRTLHITAAPARHGPVGIEPLNGPVTGFVLSIENSRAVYVSGDTVWFAGTAEVARRFDVGLAVLFTGSAQPQGAFNVTMDSNDAIEAAAAFAHAKIVSVHNCGWSHYTQSQQDLARAFDALGLKQRLEILTPAVPTTIVI